MYQEYYVEHLQIALIKSLSKYWLDRQMCVHNYIVRMFDKNIITDALVRLIEYIS